MLQVPRPVAPKKLLSLQEDDRKRSLDETHTKQAFPEGETCTPASILSSDSHQANLLLESPRPLSTIKPRQYQQPYPALTTSLHATTPRWTDHINTPVHALATHVPSIRADESQSLHLMNPHLRQSIPSSAFADLPNYSNPDPIGTGHGEDRSGQWGPSTSDLQSFGLVPQTPSQQLLWAREPGAPHDFASHDAPLFSHIESDCSPLEHPGDCWTGRH